MLKIFTLLHVQRIAEAWLINEPTLAANQLDGKNIPCIPVRLEGRLPAKCCVGTADGLPARELSYLSGKRMDLGFIDDFVCNQSRATFHALVNR